ncbi:hypothetical protein A3207_00515 [Candidatus Methanomassiliicoccus intestinalis]|uniref:Uncharacterized protein n=2 Tax=Candidatus Methanomassiliicoccus intestinalis TaxID=1406512 RepID=R9T9N8_METII|nr:hypothetical protein [Candidatus Methanomassiliicoccus intestinalis]AGN26371.1 hypothetical protein MMINT_10230 [Candidatus Methanomassiliicoccus intestinalis Issoire-Mx1]TQS84559.1 MAG: hypothetical protein A3207_00515 [Candidatus Methanomassiliicoccus intestinalis]
MSYPLVHYRKLPEALFLKLERGEIDTIVCYDPYCDISAGDTFCIFLFNTKTEMTVRKLYRRVADTPIRRPGGYAEVNVGASR